MRSLHQATMSTLFGSFLGLMALSLAGSLAGCDDADNGEVPTTRLVVTGSSTIAPLLAEIAKRFEEQNPGTRIDVQSGGSSRGLTDVRKGLADIGMVSRALSSKEADLHGFLLALDELAMIAHASNPLSEISRDEVVSIYTAATENWRELDGPAAPITVVHKAEGRSTLEVFLAHFKLDNAAVKPDVVIGDNEQGIKTVAANPTAIGYVSVGAGQVAMAEGTPIKLLPVAVRSGESEPQAGSLSMTRELTLVTAKEPEGLAKSFLDFATSPAIADLIERQSFVPPRR